MQISITRSRHTFAILCFGAVGFFLLAFFLGSRSADDGLASVERLQLVWPDVLDLPHEDRLLLARLSIDCNLNQAPKERDAVIGCLKRAAEASSDDDVGNDDLSRVKVDLQLLLDAAPAQ